MKKTILLVDDELDVCCIVKTRLEHFHYKVVTLNTGEEVFGWLERNIPDLILLDIFLPNMHGDEICKQLKSNDKLKHIPVILYSAKTDDISKEARQVCANDCIARPFESEQLLTKIKNLIG